MPNHVHMIVQITNVINDNEKFMVNGNEGTDKRKGTVPRAPTETIEKYGKPSSKSIPTMIRFFKGGVTRMVKERQKHNFRIWQRNYYEHIIKNIKEYENICKYIEENPIKYINSPNLERQSWIQGIS